MSLQRSNTNMYKHFPSNHKKNTKAATHNAQQVDDAQLFRRLCEATFAVTPNTRPQHTLLARQNRCLQGVCKSRSAGISHSVSVEIELGESGVRLGIFHSTHANEKVAACVLSHTTEPAWSKFCLQRNACEDARDVCATACQGFVRIAILDCSDHPRKRTGVCMRDDTHHCTRVFPILPNIIKP